MFYIIGSVIIKLKIAMSSQKVNYPFNFNLYHYLHQKGGKKHYWGQKGKDYGFFQSQINSNSQFSPQPNLRKNLKSICLNNIKQYPDSIDQLKVNENTKFEKIAMKEHQLTQRKQQKRSQQNVKIKLQSNLHEYQSQPARVRFSTLPNDLDEYLIQNQKKYNSKKGKNLSLFSKNINLSLNEQSPKVLQKIKNKFETNTKQEVSLKILEPKTIQHKYSKQKVYSQSNGEVEQFTKPRILITKRLSDRKNNPTFCNSLAYPLNCYRYVE